MLKDKEYNQAEELSRCLDCLSDVEPLVAKDEEIQELMEVAALVKQSFPQEDLPKELIDQMVEELAVELEDQKQKRRNPWLYGGLIGTAAAVCIAAFVQFLLPQSLDHHIAQRADDTIKTPQQVAAVEQYSDPAIAQSSPMTLQQSQPGHSVDVPASVPAEEKPANSVSKVIAEIIQETESPKTDQMPNQVATLHQDTPNDGTMQQSMVMAEINNKALPARISAQPEHRIAMVVPNQKAKSIKVDPVSGMIQQIYHLGRNDEIIITQRLLDEGAGDARDEKQGEVQALADSVAAEPFSKKAKDSMNSITIKIDKYDITIQGNKTAAELQKIAESLTAKEMER
jgi:hypothetical protein